MTEEDIQQVIQEYAAQYPALLTVDQAVTIGGIRRATLYEWSSDGRLDGIKAKRGGRLRLHRDRYVRFLTTDDEPVMI